MMELGQHKNIFQAKSFYKQTDNRYLVYKQDIIQYENRHKKTKRDSGYVNEMVRNNKKYVSYLDGSPVSQSMIQN